MIGVKRAGLSASLALTLSVTQIERESLTEFSHQPGRVADEKDESKRQVMSFDNQQCEQESHVARTEASFWYTRKVILGRHLT